MAPSVCLDMIVKDEAPVIRRCLASVKPYVDHWVIVDTGSTDGTQDIVREAMRGVPGELHERPWRDFAHNRSEAIELARGKGDYLFFIDADDIFVAPPGWRWPPLTADAYDVASRRGEALYPQRLLVANRLPWRYEGVVHEHVTTDAPIRAEALDGPWVDRRCEGARSRDPDTFRKDAALLERALAEDPSNARSAFYLAQSWRDAGELVRAREAYRRRAAMGGWDEEVWYSLYQVAVVSERLGDPLPEVRDAYLEAYRCRPLRAEPLVQLARLHRERAQWGLALAFARAAVPIPRPKDILFVDEPAYDWRALDELGTAAYWAGSFAEGRRAVERLLTEGKLPPAERARVERNRRYYAELPAA